MKKTARHERCSISQPPITGPIAVVIALNPDQVPMARPRSFSANELLMIARLPGTSSAAPNPCAGAGGNQLTYAGSKSAPRGRESEKRDTDQENAASSVVISEGSADKQKRREQERVRFDDPLHVNDRRVQVRLQRRQRHVHNRAVDERHARSERCRGQHPGPGRF